MRVQDRHVQVRAGVVEVERATADRVPEALVRERRRVVPVRLLDPPVLVAGRPEDEPHGLVALLDVVDADRLAAVVGVRVGAALEDGRHLERESDALLQRLEQLLRRVGVGADDRRLAHGHGHHRRGRQVVVERLPEGDEQHRARVERAKQAANRHRLDVGRRHQLRERLRRGLRAGRRAAVVDRGVEVVLGGRVRLGPARRHGHHVAALAEEVRRVRRGARRCRSRSGR